MEKEITLITSGKINIIISGRKVKSLEEGGLNMIDFVPMNGTLKLKWLQLFIKNQNKS